MKKLIEDSRALKSEKQVTGFNCLKIFECHTTISVFPILWLTKTMRLSSTKYHCKQFSRHIAYIYEQETWEPESETNN